METTDDSRQPLDITWSNRDDCSANASIVAGGVLAWLDVNRRAQSQWCCRVEVLTSTEHITAIGQRGHASAEDAKSDARKLYLHLTRDYGAMLDARDDLERRAIKAERERDEARAEAIAEREKASIRGDKVLDGFGIFGDVKALRAVVQGVADLRRERDEANARIKELEHQGDRRHARILAEEVATLRGQLANMNASRDEAIRQRDRLMHTSLEGWHLLSIAAQRMLATLKGADVDGDVTLDPREIAVMLDCEQRNVADLVRGARARETWQERVREEIRAVTDRVLQVKP